VFAAPFGLFFGFIMAIWLVAFGSLILAIAALISIARLPAEAFGPWWDNTKQLWIIGLAVSFVVPLGTTIAGIMWFMTGRAPLRAGHGIAGRPFWAGPPKPPPVMPPPGWPGYSPPPYSYPAPPPGPVGPVNPPS
jgi:hypothetical protein